MQSAASAREGVLIEDDLVPQPSIDLSSLYQPNFQLIIFQDKHRAADETRATNTIEDDNLDYKKIALLKCDALAANNRKKEKATTYKAFRYTGNCISLNLMSSNLSTNFAELKRLAALNEINSNKRSCVDKTGDTLVQKHLQNLAEETAILAEDEVRRMQNAVYELEAMLADDTLGQPNIIASVLPSVDIIEDCRNVVSDASNP